MQRSRLRPRGVRAASPIHAAHEKSDGISPASGHTGCSMRGDASSSMCAVRPYSRRTGIIGKDSDRRVSHSPYSCSTGCGFHWRGGEAQFRLIPMMHRPPASSHPLRNSFLRIRLARPAPSKDGCCIAGLARPIFRLQITSILSNPALVPRETLTVRMGAGHRMIADVILNRHQPRHADHQCSSLRRWNCPHGLPAVRKKSMLRSKR